MAELVTRKRETDSDSHQAETPPGKKAKIIVAEEEVETRGQQVLNNPLILGRIFLCLLPADVKTATLVCRSWWAVLELPRFWTWASVRLGRKNFSARRQSPRLRHVGGVLCELDLTARQLSSVIRLVVERRSSLTSLNFSGSDLSSVSPQLLSRATVRLQRATFYDSNLTADQVRAVFTGILEAEDLRLERLKITLTGLESVEPGTLSRALVRVREVPLLSSTNLTEQQMTAVFTQIAHTPLLRLSKLRLHWMDFSSVEPGLFSQALVRLEQVDLHGSVHTEAQMLELFQRIVGTKQLRLRNLRLLSSVASNPALTLLSPGLLSQALVRLERADLSSFILTPHQGKALFKAIVESPELRLRRLTVVAGLYLLFAKRCEQYLSQALVRLEKVNISGFCFKPKVADAICETILATDKIKLRSLKLWRTEDFPASPTLLNEVKAKIIVEFFQV